MTGTRARTLAAVLAAVRCSGCGGGSSSPFKSKKEWRNEHFQRNTRYENVLFKGENVLTPEGLSQVLHSPEKMENTFFGLCFI